MSFYVTEMYDINMPFDELIEAGIAEEDTGVWLERYRRFSNSRRITGFFP